MGEKQTWLLVAYCWDAQEGVFHRAMTPSELAATDLPVLAVWRETFSLYGDAEACGDENDPDENLDGWEVLVAAIDHNVGPVLTFD